MVLVSMKKRHILPRYDWMGRDICLCLWTLMHARIRYMFGTWNQIYSMVYLTIRAVENMNMQFWRVNLFFSYALKKIIKISDHFPSPMHINIFEGYLTPWLPGWFVITNDSVVQYTTYRYCDRQPYTTCTTNLIDFDN